MTISQYTPLDLQICFSDCCCVVPIKSIYEKMCSNLFHNKQQTHVSGFSHILLQHSHAEIIYIE